MNNRIKKIADKIADNGSTARLVKATVTAVNGATFDADVGGAVLLGLTLSAPFQHTLIVGSVVWLLAEPPVFLLVHQETAANIDVNNIDTNLSATFSDPPSAFPSRVSVRYMSDFTGSPTGSGSWTTLTAKRSDTVCFQITIWRTSNPGATTPDMYYRHGHEGGTGGPWSAWKPLHRDSGWQIVTDAQMSGGWINYQTGAWGVQYRKIGNVVHMQGLIKSGTFGSTAFTLAAGYRPFGTILFNAMTNTGPSRLDVMSTGSVVPSTIPGGQSNGYVSVACSWVVAD